MIEGLMLGFISWLSILLTWWHMPARVKDWCLNHPVISDITAGALTYFFLSSISKSLVAAVGAVFSGLLINLSIMGAHWSQDARRELSGSTEPSEG